MGGFLRAEPDLVQEHRKLRVLPEDSGLSQLELLTVVDTQWQL